MAQAHSATVGRTWRNRLPLNLAPCFLIASGIVAEAVVHPALEHMDLVAEVVAEIQHVVFDFHRPVVPQGIFSADAEHPSAERLVKRRRRSHAVQAGESIGTDVGPGASQFAVDEPTIGGPAEPRSERGNPVEAGFTMRESGSDPGNEDRHRSGVLYTRRRYVPFDPKHPLANLVVESDLAAADKTALAIVATGPPAADMAADIEPGPVVNDGQRRSIGRWPPSIGGLSHNVRRGQRRCNAADCQESVHCMAPGLQTAPSRDRSSKRSGPHNANCALYLRAGAESETV